MARGLMYTCFSFISFPCLRSPNRHLRLRLLKELTEASQQVLVCAWVIPPSCWPQWSMAIPRTLWCRVWLSPGPSSVWPSCHFSSPVALHLPSIFFTCPFSLLQTLEFKSSLGSQDCLEKGNLSKLLSLEQVNKQVKTMWSGLLPLKFYSSENWCCWRVIHQGNNKPVAFCLVCVIVDCALKTSNEQSLLLFFKDYLVSYFDFLSFLISTVCQMLMAAILHLSILVFMYIFTCAGFYRSRLRLEYVWVLWRTRWTLLPELYLWRFQINRP